MRVDSPLTSNGIGPLGEGVRSLGGPVGPRTSRFKTMFDPAAPPGGWRGDLPARRQPLVGRGSSRRHRTALFERISGERRRLTPDPSRGALRRQGKVPASVAHRAIVVAGRLTDYGAQMPGQA